MRWLVNRITPGLRQQEAGLGQRLKNVTHAILVNEYIKSIQSANTVLDENLICIQKGDWVDGERRCN